MSWLPVRQFTGIAESTEVPRATGVQRLATPLEFSSPPNVHPIASARGLVSIGPWASSGASLAALVSEIPDGLDRLPAPLDTHLREDFMSKKKARKSRLKDLPGKKLRHSEQNKVRGGMMKADVTTDEPSSGGGGTSGVGGAVASSISNVGAAVGSTFTRIGNASGSVFR